MYYETVSGPMIPRYRAHVRRLKLPMQPDKLVKASFDSTAKLDGDSRGLDSTPIVYGPLDRLAEHGIVPLNLKAAVMPSLPVIDRQAFIGPKFQVERTLPHRVYRSVSNNAIATNRTLPIQKRG